MISTIRLQNFRSYSDESFEFEPGVNIIVGPNASGKTNLLESVLVLASGSSYRARDIELIKIGKDWTRLEGFFDKERRILKIKRRESVTEKTIDIDSKTYRRLVYDLTIPTVFFEPSDMQIITRGPELRRDFIDGLLEKSLVEYKTILNKYRRALAQRNSLLKKAPSFGRSQMFAWNLRLSELGEKIALSRQELVDTINKQISRTYSSVAHKRTSVKLEYSCQFSLDNYASKMLKKLEAALNQDYERGFTAYGPHRDDINFYLNNKQVNQTASRGEVRSLVLSLKIFESQLVEKARNQVPILLLDDVFSELDGARRQALVDQMKAHQVIITTTDADSVIDHFAKNYSLLALVNQ